MRDGFPQGETPLLAPSVRRGMRQNPTSPLVKNAAPENIPMQTRRLLVQVARE